MIRHKIVQFLMAFILLFAQILVMPFTLSASLSFSLLLPLMIIFSLKESRYASIIWAAIFGGITDLILFEYIGFYGITFTIASYILGLIGHKMVISGIIPFIFLSIMTFVFVFWFSTLLMILLLGSVNFYLLLPPFFVGIFTTPLFTLIVDFLYRRIEMLIEKR